MMTCTLVSAVRNCPQPTQCVIVFRITLQLTAIVAARLCCEVMTAALFWVVTLQVVVISYQKKKKLQPLAK